MGFQKAKNDIILVMDGDLQHRPEEIKKLYNKIKIDNIKFSKVPPQSQMLCGGIFLGYQSSMIMLLSFNE